MSINRTQIVSVVQRTLEDLTGIFYTNLEIEDSIQDAYDEFLSRTGFLKQTVSLPIVGGNIYYNLNGLLSSKTILRVNKCFSNVINRWIHFYDIRFLANQRFDWECTKGTTWYGCIITWNWLGFFPHYGSTISSFDLLVTIGQDSILSDLYVLQIPDSFNKAIFNYCIADMLEQQQEFSKSQGFWEEYEEVMLKARNNVVHGSDPWQFEQLEDVNFPDGTVP